MSEILFIGGPSGSGKSFFASKYLTSLGWRHLEIDLYPKDGITEHGLRTEWDRFYQQHDPLPLRDALLGRAEGSPGIVLSFPGNLIFSAQLVAVVSDMFRIAYLYGHPSHCLRAFLAREHETGRGLTASHWDQNNRNVFGGLSCPPQHRFLVDAFTPDGGRRELNLIYDDIFRPWQNVKAEVGSGLS